MEMEPAARRTNHPQVHKPYRSIEGQEISISKPAVIRSHSTRVESVRRRKTTTTTLTSQNKPYSYLAEDGQLVSNSNKPLNKSQVWDCGSSLYDSFELRSLHFQLDLAIKGSSRRTLSMPHLPERHAPDCISPPKSIPITTSTIEKHQNVPKYFGRVSKSFHKILRSMFGSSKTVNIIDNATSSFTKAKTYSERQNGSLYVCEGSKSMRALTTIPEMQEVGDGHPKFSPDATPAVRRAASERFAASSAPVSCL